MKKLAILLLFLFVHQFSFAQETSIANKDLYHVAKLLLKRE